MKIRLSHVSNSSSSGFVLLHKKKLVTNEDIRSVLFPDLGFDAQATDINKFHELSRGISVRAVCNFLVYMLPLQEKLRSVSKLKNLLNTYINNPRYCYYKYLSDENKKIISKIKELDDARYIDYKNVTNYDVLIQELKEEFMKKLTEELWAKFEGAYVINTEFANDNGILLENYMVGCCPWRNFDFCVISRH